MPFNDTPHEEPGRDRIPLFAPQREASSYVPSWHPEGGTMAARTQALAQEQTIPWSAHGAMLGGTAAMMAGLVVVHGGIDPWLGATATTFGMVTLLRGMYRARRPRVGLL